MAFYKQRRRFRRDSRRWRARRISRRSREDKIMKRDLERLSYPSKIKFVGMTQKRSFLIREEVQEVDFADDKSRIILALDPRLCKNWEKYIGTNSWSGTTQNRVFKAAQYQTFTIDKIYVHVFPKSTVYTATENSPIVRMTYNMYQPLVPGSLEAEIRGEDEYKDTYSFGGQKEQTFVIRRPKVIVSGDAFANKSKSEVLISAIGFNNGVNGSASLYEEDDDDENYEADLNRNQFNCGYLCFSANAASNPFRVEVAYRVTVRN